MSYYTDGMPLLSPIGDMRGPLAQAVQDIALHTNTQILNVKDFECADFEKVKGDGVHDDTTGIQAAIDYAKTVGTQVRFTGDVYQQADRLGTTIFFPPGQYLITSPLVMPRSGTLPGFTVGLMGTDRFSTTLVAGSTFPINRGVIEWEAVAKRVIGQRFTGLGFSINSISGAMAFYFLPTLLDTRTHINQESMNFCVFDDLTFITDCSKNVDAVRIRGQVDYSKFTNLILDSGGIAGPNSTNLLHFDEDENGVPIPVGERGFDIAGANSCEIRTLTQSFRGGDGTLINGRLGNCEVNNVICGNGAYLAANCIRLKSSANVILDGLVFEGRQEDGELLLDACSDVYIRATSLGRTDVAPGVGIKLTNECHRIRWDGVFSDTGIPPFSANGSKLLSIDAASTDCVFTGLSSEATFANEIDWGSTGANRNRIEYRDGLTNLITVLDERPGFVSTGNGSPEGVVAAPIGALYSRADGGAGTTLYVKQSGVGNTGWVAVVP